jgi:hypothetical protein
MTDSTTKRCPKCGRDLPRSDFQKNRKRDDGVQTYCKVCSSALAKTRNATPERKQAQNESRKAKRAVMRVVREAAQAQIKATLRSASEKVCCKCGETKPIGDYTVDDRYVDGRYPWCFDCRRAWRSGRKEHQRDLEREWAAKNPDRVRELGRQFYARHKDRIAPKRRAYDRQRYHTDLAFRQRKNAQTAIKNRRRRAMLYGIETQHHTEKEWQALCERYDHRCLRCDQQVLLSRDHIVPVTKGGSDTIDNIQPLCRSCNSWKNARTIDYRPDRGD